MSSDLIGFVSLIIGLVSFAASVVFFVVGRKTEEQNQAVLEKINVAIQSWQGQIMSSSIELLESRAEIVGKRVVLEEAKAKQAFLASISERIKYLVEVIPPEKLNPAQSHQLDTLLKAFEVSTRSSVPPQAIEQIIVGGSEK